jgi:hypothetical protein
MTIHTYLTDLTSTKTHTVAITLHLRWVVRRGQCCKFCILIKIVDILSIYHYFEGRKFGCRHQNASQRRAQRPNMRDQETLRPLPSVKVKGLFTRSVNVVSWRRWEINDKNRIDPDFLLCRRCDATMVARWFLLKPRIPIWVNFGGPQIGKCLYKLWPFGIFYRHMGYFMTIWYIFSGLGIMYRE